MFIKQISIFAENRPGSVMEITAVLRDADINMRALSIADSTDFGVIRLIVDKTDAAIKALRDKGMTVAVTDVIAVSVADRPGAFHLALEALYEGNVLLEYSYAFVAPIGGEATVILRCREADEAVRRLQAKGLRLLEQNEVNY